MRASTRTLLAGGLLATSLAFAAAPASPAAAATSPIRVSVIGDESLAALEDANKPTRDIITATYATAFDAACGRETVTRPNPTWCNIGKVPSVLEVVQATNGGDLGQVLVVMSGYNDRAETFDAALDQVMAAAQAQGVQRVIWLNLKLTGASPAAPNQLPRWTSINQTLQDNVAQHGGRLVVADWDTASAALDQSFFFATPNAWKIRTNFAQPLATFIKEQIDANLDGITPPPAPPGNPGADRCLPTNAIGTASPAPSPKEYGFDTRGSSYTPIVPKRLLDTRPDPGDTVNRMLGAGRVLRVDFTDRAADSSTIPTFNGIPANATAVTLNVTAVTPCAGGFLTVFPCAPGGPPLSSSVNYRAGQIVANSVTVKLGDFNRVCVYSLVQTDVIVDVAGFYAESTGAGHASATPLRLLDTRPGMPAVDPRKGPILGQTDLSLQVRGVGTVPANATGVVLNVTAVNTTANGFLAAYPGPCGPLNRPTVSNVNFRQGQVVPNSVSVKLGASGNVCFYSNVTTDLIVDVNASFGPSATTELRSATPLRVLDTRPGSPAALGIKGKLTGTVPLSVPVLSAVPNGAANAADSVLLNVTVTEPDIGGFLAAYPCGGAIPTVSNVNFLGGETRPNLVDVKVGAGGNVCLVSNVGTHVVVDLLGWYQTDPVT